MKKLLSCFMLVLSICTCFTLNVQSIYADEVDSTNDSIIFEYDHGFERLASYVEIDGTKHQVYFNELTGVLKIDNELIESVSEELYITNATIDYSSATHLRYKIPYRSVLATATVLSTVLRLPNAFTVASALASALSSDSPDIWVTYTQYRSRETYVSSYNGQSYHKNCYRNINFYENRIGGKLLYHIDGEGWWDPIRP